MGLRFKIVCGLKFQIAESTKFTIETTSKLRPVFASVMDGLNSTTPLYGENVVINIVVKHCTTN